MTFWLTRGRISAGSDDSVFYNKTRNERATNTTRYVCYESFQALTGIKLRPGYTVRVSVGKPENTYPRRKRQKR